MTNKLILLLGAFLLLTVAACSGNSAEDYFNNAEAKISEEKYQEALADFEMIIKEHPESEYADDALFETGKLYHGHAIQTLPKRESLEKAIVYYTRLIENYPDFPEVQKAHFMIGFIQANELNEIAAARTTYNNFIQKYPESELAVSAKAELDNLGIPPEEILKKRRDTEE